MGQVDTLTKTQGDLARSVEASNNASTAAQEAKDAAVTKCHEAEQAAEDALEAQANAERELRDAQDMIASLTEDKATLTDQKGDLETQVAILAEALGTDAEGLIKTPFISGSVIAVDTSMSPGLIGINKGSADGVNRGFVFEVFSGGQYKGKAKVEAVQANSCAATIISTYEGRTMTAGDSASTKI